MLVTAHAVVRFLERERGVDMEEVRALVRRRPGTALATDQDVLQYLSRDVGISISSVRSAILTPALLAAIDERGGRAGTYPLTDRCRARVADHTVITILLKEE